jgi:hypothetical protein
MNLRPSADSPKKRAHRAPHPVICAALSGTLLIGCADSSPPPQNANDVKAGASGASANSNGATQNQNASESGDSNKTTRYAGWIVVAVGAQSAIFAAVTSVMMLHENSVRSSECNAQKVCSSTGLDANNKIDAMAPFNAGSWIVAAAGLGVGAYLVLTSPPKSDASSTAPSSSPATASIGVGPNGSGMGLNFRSLF